MGIFTNSVIREIGRNVGKGLSNDLFGDWHATPVKASINNSLKQGWDLNYVNPEEYNIEEQPFYKYASLISSFFLYGVFFTIIFPLIAFVWVIIIYLLLKKTTNLYAKVPMRRKDGRTKVGYREMGSAYVKLKSKRNLTSEELKNNRVTALIILLGHLLVIGLVFYGNSIS